MMGMAMIIITRHTATMSFQSIQKPLTRGPQQRAIFLTMQFTSSALFLALCVYAVFSHCSYPRLEYLLFDEIEASF